MPCIPVEPEPNIPLNNPYNGISLAPKYVDIPRFPALPVAVPDKDSPLTRLRPIVALSELRRASDEPEETRLCPCRVSALRLARPALVFRLQL